MAKPHQHLGSNLQCQPEQHQAAQPSRRPQRRANNADTASLAAIAGLIRSAPTVPVLSYLRDTALARWKAAYLAQPLEQQSSFASEFQTTFPTEHEALTKAIPYSPRCSTLVKWLADKSKWKLQALEVFAVFGTRSEQRLKEVKVIAGMCEREKGMALVQGLNKRDHDGYVNVRSYKAVVAQLEKEGCERAPTRSRRNGVPKGTVEGKDTGQPEQSIAQCDKEVEGQSAEQSHKDDEGQSRKDDGGQSVEQSHKDDEGQSAEQSRKDDEDQGIAQSHKDRRQPSCEDDQEQGAESSVERSVEKRRGGHEPDLLDVSNVFSRGDDGELDVYFADDDAGGDGDETESGPIEDSARDVLSRPRHATASSFPRHLPHSRPHQSGSRLFHSRPLEHETFLQSPPRSPSPPHVTFVDAHTQTTPVIPTSTMSTINTAPGFAAAWPRPTAAESTNKRRRMEEGPCASVDVDTTQLAACFKSLGVEDAPTQISDLLDGSDTEWSVRAWVLKGALELLQTPGTPITHTPAALMQNLQSHASCSLEPIKSEPSGDEITDAALLAARIRAAEVEAEHKALGVAREVQFGISEMVKSTTNQINDETLKAQRRKCAGFTEIIEKLDPHQDSENIKLLENSRSAAESRLKEMEGWVGKKDQLVEVVRDYHDSYSKAVMRISKRVVTNRKRVDQIAVLLSTAELSTPFTTSHA
ncbi:unnamed protein product [Zymoseptoria tritici ST99CH_1A5]|uniref:Uncharacterized protein n=1 Tax=Zymoseptoria tritici ST99CH_1A5 TaxID=1276529 RepID=A0A1Y6M5T6_ZYMTR|nr:unnamed protein product [Zymoseptoria tritici ST99CH_1A5]